MKTVRTKISFKQLMMLSVALLAAGCGSSETSANSGKQPENAKAGSPSTQGPAALPSSVTSTPSTVPNVQGLIVIREQQSGHAALFAALPDQPGAVYGGASLCCRQ
jgi:uncharacterized lipoprotein YmbA